MCLLLGKLFGRCWLINYWIAPMVILAHQGIKLLKSHIFVNRNDICFHNVTHGHILKLGV